MKTVCQDPVERVCKHVTGTDTGTCTPGLSPGGT